MARFRLMVCSHVANNGGGEERLWNPGDVIESKRDLERRWPEKFIWFRDDEPLSAGIDQTVKPDDELEEEGGIAVATARDDLDSKTIQQLRELAEAEEINLGAAKNKEDIIRLIRAS